MSSKTIEINKIAWYFLTGFRFFLSWNHFQFLSEIQSFALELCSINLSLEKKSVAVERERTKRMQRSRKKEMLSRIPLWPCWIAGHLKATDFFFFLHYFYCSYTTVDYYVSSYGICCCCYFSSFSFSLEWFGIVHIFAIVTVCRCHLPWSISWYDCAHWPNTNPIRSHKGPT